MWIFLLLLSAVLDFHLISAPKILSAVSFSSACFLLLSHFFPVDASAAMQVRALKDYCNNYDLTSLNIKAGDIITVP